MTVTISGSTGITGPNTDNDVVLNGVTVGLGANSVSTNTVVGTSALASGSLSGGNNTGVGYLALQSNTTASNVTAVGRAALNSNTTGDANTGIGGNSLLNNSTGAYNSAFGQGALQSNTTASNNTAVGYQTLYSNTTANYNTAVGSQAGYSVTTDYGNTFIGQGSGYSFNKASAGSYTNNTFVGISSGYYVTTGAKNTIIGNYNGNQGGLDIRTSSNYIVLSDGDGNPQAYCDGQTWNFGLGGTGGNQYGRLNLFGSASAGYGPIVFGYANGSVVWGAGSYSQISGATQYTTYAVKAGTGTTNGVLLTSNSSSWSTFSDPRLKNITGTYASALSDISQIKPIKFTWKSDEQNIPQVGVDASTVEAVVPEAIDKQTISKDDSTEYLTVRYTELIPLMIASIQELNTLVTTQATTIATMQAQIAALTPKS
jgi:trimeric autotransporter adhesin